LNGTDILNITTELAHDGTRISEITDDLQNLSE
jgi:hypothetical protein